MDAGRAGHSQSRRGHDKVAMTKWQIRVEVTGEQSFPENRSLADAESAKERVENVVVHNRSRDLTEFIERHPQLPGDDLISGSRYDCGQRILDALSRPFDRLATSLAGHRDHILIDFAATR